MTPGPILRVEDLHTWIYTGESVVRAVDGVSFHIPRGETFALVGESGCGKSLTALSVMRLLPDAGQIVHGKVLLDGIDVLALPETRMRDVRGARMAMIFQEPMLSLNPVMTIGAQIAEALRRHTALERAALERRVLDLLDAVRIPDPVRLDSTTDGSDASARDAACPRRVQSALASPLDQTRGHSLRRSAH